MTKDDNTSLVYDIRHSTYKKNPQKFFLAILSTIFSCILVEFMFQTPIFALITLVLCFISLPEVFFPIRYKIFENKIIIDRYFYKLEKGYDYYKRVLSDENGIFLSPYRFKTRMEQFRGVLLLIPIEKREEIISYLKEKIENN